jgi:hypothetical protein
VGAFCDCPSGSVIVANDACLINFLLFKLLINFKISWSLKAEPFMTI